MLACMHRAHAGQWGVGLHGAARGPARPSTAVPGQASPHLAVLALLVLSPASASRCRQPLLPCPEPACHALPCAHPGPGPCCACVYPACTAGRLLEEGSLYSQYLLETLKDSFPTSDVCYPTVSLAEGAAWVAWAAAKAKAPAAPAAGPVGEAAEGEGEGSADPAGAAVVAAAEAAGAAAAASTAADTTSTQAQAAQLPGPVTEP